MRRGGARFLQLPKGMVPAGQVLVDWPAIFARQKRQHRRVIINLTVIRFENGVLVILRITWKMLACNRSEREIRIHFMRKGFEKVATCDVAQGVHEKDSVVHG